MTLLDELLEIERRLWQNDADVYAATYLPEAMLILPHIGRIGLDTAARRSAAKTPRAVTGPRSHSRRGGG